MRSPFRRDRRELAAAKSQVDRYEKAEKVVEKQLEIAQANAEQTRINNERIRRAHLEKNGFTEMLQAAWEVA